MDAGDLATWVGSTFAALAAGATLWTLKSQRQQIGEQREFIGEQLRHMAEQQQNLELERAELRVAAEDRKWAQAQRIKMESKRQEQRGEGGTFWTVHVSNLSDSPVRDLHVRFGSAYVAAGVHDARGSSVGERLGYPLYLLGPGREAVFHSQAWPEATTHNNRPTLTFADAVGARWSLDSHGSLAEASADPTT